MSELTLLQAVHFKGRIRVPDLAATVGEDAESVAASVTELVAAGALVEGAMLKISPEGRARLTELLEEERSGVDQDAIAAAYAEFRSVNSDFKALVSDWQLRDGMPNDHDDAGYDGAVLARLADVHARVLPIIADASGQIPRLRAYAQKLSEALQKVQNGETQWLTRPIVDSYHTVWFELHEELILTAGLTRVEEARSGHAQ
jgi:hypothetical protein